MQHESPYIAPRMTVRVAVTGHRPNKLDADALRSLEAPVADLLKAIAETAGALRAEDAEATFGAFEAAAPMLRLTTAMAPGADMLVSRLAAERGFRLNAILPFRREIYETDFSVEERAAFVEMYDGDTVDTRTELDVTAEAGDTAGYAAVGSALLDYCDILIALWDGKPAAGPGGTAQVVGEALARRQIVLHVKPDGSCVMRTLPQDSDEDRWLPFDKAVLAAQMRALLVLPQGEARDRLQRFAEVERLRSGSFAFSYWMLQWFYGLKDHARLFIDYGLARERDSAWAETRTVARANGGEVFADTLDRAMRARWIAADNVALHWGNRFRSAFVANFTLAALAVFFAMVPVLNFDHKPFKAVFVGVEFAVILVALLKTRQARRREWRVRWLDCRRLAETLRPARLPLLVAGSPAGSGHEALVDSSERWIVWYALSALREVPPPSGVIGEQALERSREVALAEIDGQIAYHEGTAASLHDLDHGLERTAERALAGTLIVGGLYVVLFLLYKFTDIHTFGALVDAYKPPATLLGAILPVIGAAAFGIRAMGDFRSLASQSRRMAEQLAALRRRLEMPVSATARSSMIARYATVGRVMSDDLRLWGMIYSERHLTPGF